MLVLIVAFFLLIALGTPIAFAMGMAGFVYIESTLGGGIVLATLPQRFITGLDSFTFLAIPFFILIGELMNHGGTTKRLIDLAAALVGRFTGGLAHVNVVTNMLMSGMSGAAVADAAATGSVLVPAMEKSGYSRGFAAALSASAACIGPVIPPSIPFVLVGSIAGISIGKLFLGGAIPGVIMGLYLMLAAYWVSRRRGYGSADQEIQTSTRRALAAALPALLLPVIIIGGIVIGVVTPTESAVLGSAYALFLGCCVYCGINGRMLPQILVNTILTSSQVLFVIAAANVLSWVIAREQFPAMVTQGLEGLTTNPWIVLGLINVFLLVWGCVVETAASIILLMPILLPIVENFGIDPVHFGVVVVVNLMIGLMTPPIGMNMFVLCAIAKVSVAEFTKEAIPFLIALLLTLLVVTYVPQTVTWLPSLLMR